MQVGSYVDHRQVRRQVHRQVRRQVHRQVRRQVHKQVRRQADSEVGQEFLLGRQVGQIDRLGKQIFQVGKLRKQVKQVGRQIRQVGRLGIRRMRRRHAEKMVLKQILLFRKLKVFWTGGVPVLLSRPILSCLTFDKKWHRDFYIQANSGCGWLSWQSGCFQYQRSAVRIQSQAKFYKVHIYC